MKWDLGIVWMAIVDVGCGSAQPEPTRASTAPRMSEPSGAAKKRSGPPTACGEVAYAHDCPADRDAKFECFVHALEDCQPATLRIRRTTIEGGKVVHDFVVLRAADGSCLVEGRYDERGDRFGGRASVTTSRCKGVKPLGIPGCTTLGMDGC
jgi:hypothetical protein